jgi:hypothetical protein
MPYALCYFLIRSNKGHCKLQKIEKRTLKFARPKETGKISDESPSKVGFLGSANVSIFLPVVNKMPPSLSDADFNRYLQILKSAVARYL